jgi:hypothetical protein
MTVYTGHEACVPSPRRPHISKSEALMPHFSLKAAGAVQFGKLAQ